MQRFVTFSDRGFDRLVWVNRGVSPEFWDDQWQQLDIARLVQSAEMDTELLPVLLGYLRPGDTVLEAGCGLGQWVEILSRRGFDTFGVDYAISTLAMAFKFAGRQRYIGADIFALPFAAESFDAVISLGVVEHFWEGPARLIREMVRVLRPEGLLLLSVPFFNLLRRIKARAPGMPHRVCRQEPPGFYQYVFEVKELNGFLRECDLEPVGVFPYASVKGLKDEVALLGKFRHYCLQSGESRPAPADGPESQAGGILPGKRSLSKTVKDFLKDTLSTVVRHGYVQKAAGHMIMIAARKR